jgi:hypothetical protein
MTDVHPPASRLYVTSGAARWRAPAEYFADAIARSAAKTLGNASSDSAALARYASSLTAGDSRWVFA